MKKSFLIFAFFTLCFTAAYASDIADIDKNFKPATVDNLSVHYFNALNSPFEVSGFPWWERGTQVHRLPAHFTESEVNKGALKLSTHTSGGTIRFRSDSSYVTLRSALFNSYDMNHMPRTGSAGFDLYYKDANGSWIFAGAVQPARAHTSRAEILERKIGSNFQKKEMREFILYLPLYGGFESLEIGLEPNAKIEKPLPWKISKPILFYGSSITQGGCASKPSNNYTSMLCRAVDAPQINLGFSGSGKGEIAVAKAIAELDISVFVMDYDANAPDAEHLEATHEKFFKAVREKNLKLPIIMMSNCSRFTDERTAIIKKTYDNARASGDKYVWFIDGAELFGGLGNGLCTVDNSHPNDLGFYMMHKKILPVLEEALKNLKK